MSEIKNREVEEINWHFLSTGRVGSSSTTCSREAPPSGHRKEEPLLSSNLLSSGQFASSYELDVDIKNHLVSPLKSMLQFVHFGVDIFMVKRPSCDIGYLSGAVIYFIKHILVLKLEFILSLKSPWESMLPILTTKISGLPYGYLYFEDSWA